MTLSPTESIDLDALTAAVRTCPSVAALSPGLLGEVATYLPGRRVVGVRVEEDRVEVHVIARWVESLPAAGAEVAEAVRPFAGGRRVEVFIDDLDDHER